MPRWRQVVDPKTGKSNFLPLDSAAKSQSHFIHGDIEPFKSPIDGSIISDRRQLEEHNKRHNVVNAAEFSPEFYEMKAKERANQYLGVDSRQEQQKRRENLNEIYNYLERQES